MITKLGIISLLAGLFVGLFGGISKFMGAKNFWVDLTLSRLLGEDKSDSIISLLDITIIQDSLEYLIYDLPFFGFLLGMGVLLLLISLFLKNH